MLLRSEEVLCAREYAPTGSVGMAFREMESHQSRAAHCHGRSVGIFIRDGVFGFDSQPLQFRLISHHLSNDPGRPVGRPEQKTCQQDE